MQLAPAPDQNAYYHEPYDYGYDGYHGYHGYDGYDYGGYGGYDGYDQYGYAEDAYGAPDGGLAVAVCVCLNMDCKGWYSRPNGHSKNENGDKPSVFDGCFEQFLASILSWMMIPNSYV